jgi:hypothetical protein
VVLLLCFPFSSIGQRVCFYANTMITTALPYVVKSSTIIRPALFFLLKMTLVIWVVCFHTKFRIVFSSSVKMLLAFWWGLHWICRALWVVWTVTILILPVMNAGGISRSNVLLDFSHQCLTVSTIAVFHLFG